MFVLNFVLFFNLFTLVKTIFHHIVDACVEFCFLKKQFLNLTINMQLYYYCDQPSSFSQAPSACGVQCSTERLVREVFHLLVNGFTVTSFRTFEDPLPSL